MKKESPILNIKKILEKNIRQMEYYYHYEPNWFGDIETENYRIYINEKKRIVYGFSSKYLWGIYIQELEPVKKLFRTKEEWVTKEYMKEGGYYREFKEMDGIIKAEMKRRKEVKLSEVLAKIN